MKFLYVDVKNRKVVAVFQSANGENFYWTKKDVLEQKAKHQILSSWNMIQQCDDALEAMDEHKKQKPWWKFW